MSDAADAYNVTAEELRQFIERYEQLETEKKDVTEQQKELMAEAKGRGYDTKVMAKVKASDDLTVIAGEMIKSVVLHMLGDAADGIAPKELKELADAFRSAQAAQNLSTTRKAKETAALQERLSEAVTTAAKAKGLTLETTEAIKAEILGVTK